MDLKIRVAKESKIKKQRSKEERQRRVDREK